MLQDETDFEKKLSPRQLAALPRVILSGSVAEGAPRAGISRTTLYRWGSPIPPSARDFTDGEGGRWLLAS